jgi:hypothetical protein
MEETGGGFVEADADRREDAVLIAPGTVSGDLGYRRSDGSIDSSDWYRFSAEQGQIITLSLTFPQGASFSLSLYPPGSTSSVGNVETRENTKSLEYVAGESGEWFVRIYRLRGEGGYSLTIGTGGIVVSTPTPTRTPQPTPIHTPIHTPAPTPTLTPQPPPEVTPPPDLATPPPFAGYLITVVTGDKLGAGTDANVYLTLYGEKGNSTELFLDNPNRNDFERNQTDTFTIPPSQVGDLGAIRRIYLRHADWSTTGVARIIGATTKGGKTPVQGDKIRISCTVVSNEISTTVSGATNEAIVCLYVEKEHGPIVFLN